MSATWAVWPRRRSPWSGRGRPSSSCPRSSYKAAESKATPQLHVYAVNNLDQVLRILKSLGGKVPTKPVPVQAAP